MAEGHTYRAAGAHLGVSKQTARNWAIQLGCAKPPLKSKHWPANDGLDEPPVAKIGTGFCMMRCDRCPRVTECRQALRTGSAVPCEQPLPAGYVTQDIARWEYEQRMQA